MRYRILGLAMVALLAHAADAQKAPKVRIDFVQEKLPNGLHVIYSVDRTTPVVAVEVMYNVGSKNEVKGKTGIAHLFEHIMLFKGSRNVPEGQRFALLEKAGGRAGSDLNGTTSYERTNYFAQIPSNNLELALWLESDHMGTLAEALTPEKVNNQREVVKNERRQAVDNQPYGSWVEKMTQQILPETHPYYHTVIGSMDDLSAASMDDVKKFFKTYYAPNNAVLVIAGDFDVTRAKSLVKKHFSWIPRGPAVPAIRNAAVAPLLGTSKREVVQDINAAAPQVFIGYRVPSARTRHAAAVNLLGSVLAGGRSSPFYNSLVRQKQIAVGVGGGNFELLEGTDIMIFNATGKAATNPDSLEKALLAEIDKAASSIDQATLDRVRASAAFNFVNGLQGTGGFGGRADALAEMHTYYKNANRVNTAIDELNAVTVAQLRALVKERLVPNNRVTLVYVPAPKPATGTK